MLEASSRDCLGWCLLVLDDLLHTTTLTSEWKNEGKEGNNKREWEKEKLNLNVPHDIV